MKDFWALYIKIMSQTHLQSNKCSFIYLLSQNSRTKQYGLEFWTKYLEQTREIQ